MDNLREETLEVTTSMNMELEEIESLIDRDLDVQGSIEKSDETNELRIIEEFKNKERKSYIKFDSEFRNFLSSFILNYEAKEKQKLDFKDAFFWLIMGGFFILMLTPFVVILMANKLTDTAVVVSMLTVLVELVSAIIVLPKIIAEYLFNKEEDKNMMDIIKNMQAYNERKHGYFEKDDK